MIDRRQSLAMFGAGLAAWPAPALAQSSSDMTTAARNAFLYVVPLIEMAAARTRMLDHTRVGQHANLNALSYTQDLATPADHGITTPNNDTLYSNAFIDLTHGPVVLTVPDPGSRYLSVAVMDMYTNNNVVIGARTPGGPAGTYRLLGPGHTPKGPRDLVIATPHAWVLSRVLAGSEDLRAAHKLQSAVKLAGPRVPRPKIYATRASDWSAYFASAADLLKSDPPGSLAGLNDFERIRRASKAGDFARASFSSADVAAIDAGVAAAKASFTSGASARNKFVGGWTSPPSDLGQFGDNFLLRAAVAVSGLGALPNAEAIYLRAQSEDGSSIFLSDAIHRFSLSKPLPVDGFWSLTMYEATPDGQFFLTENPINRYAIGDRTPGLKRQSDGGLDIFISRSDPGGERSANWLPAPKKGPYMMSLRCYLPRRELLEAQWRPPPITPA